MPAETQSGLELAIASRPDSLARLAEVMPWAAYASERQFTPELRERLTSEGASLADYSRDGSAARFAGALYPQSVFGRGIGAVRAAPGAALDRKWMEIGTAWIAYGTELYSGVRNRPTLTATLPPGTTFDQAVTVLGARAAQQWLVERASVARPTRRRRSPGWRIPTLSAWALLRQ